MKHRKQSRPASDAEPSPPVISLVSLGCAKNTVDSECLLGNLLRAGFFLSENPEDSDLCLVNTCGFIEEARAETAQTLERLTQARQGGRPRAIVALGCLVERALQEPMMRPFLRDADAWVPFRDYPRLPAICRRLADPALRPGAPPSPACYASEPLPHDYFLDFLRSPRARIGGVHSAYLKIAEGCSNRCHYCAIPAIRGAQVSRPLEDILDEARQLIRHGAREINLVAQDTTNYGTDRYGEARLPDLLRRLTAADRAVWFRLLYAHPRHLTGEVLDLLAGGSPLCPYLDLPLQHIADSILSAMGRGLDGRATRKLLELIREKMPEGALRTTFIVGFPGETEDHFSELLELVEAGWFTHVGVFPYSREPGTPAADLKDDVPQEAKEERRARLMEAQRKISRARLRRLVGTEVEVMVDGPAGRGAGARLIGRTRLQAPGVDGVVYLCGPTDPEPPPGTTLRVRAVDARDYDLFARS